MVSSGRSIMERRTDEGARESSGRGQEAGERSHVGGCVERVGIKTESDDQETGGSQTTDGYEREREMCLWWRRRLWDGSVATDSGQGDGTGTCGRSGAARTRDRRPDSNRMGVARTEERGREVNGLGFGFGGRGSIQRSKFKFLPPRRNTTMMEPLAPAESWTANHIRLQA
jgi:hypothetical protein